MSEKDPYGFDPEFEKAVALLCAQQPKFWGAVGHALEPDLLEIDECKLVVKAAAAIAKDNGHGPTTQLILMQRLHRWRTDGQVSQQQINDVLDLFFDAPKLPPVQEVIKELVPVLRRRIDQDVVRTTMEEYTRKGNFANVVKMVRQAERLGSHDTSIGTRLGSGSFDEIARMRHLDRLPLGITELDMGLGGGLPRGALGCVAGSSGGGKSMMLSHTASYATAAGLFVVYATLELPQGTVFARVKANLTGVPIDSIIAGDDRLARQKIDEIYPILGTFIVQDFPAKATTMPDVREWVKHCEEAEGREVDLVVIDYADKMASHNANDKNEYSAQGTVYEDFRLFVKEGGKWGLTASQAKNKAAREKRRRIEIDDFADSTNKGRVIDLGVTINPTGEGDDMEYFVAKNRNGRAQFSVGPLPHDWACGRMVAGSAPPGI